MSTRSFNAGQASQDATVVMPGTPAPSAGKVLGVQSIDAQSRTLLAWLDPSTGGGGGGGGSPVAITQTIVNLTPNTDATLIPANNNRKSLSLITTGGGDVTLNFGAAATIGQGWPLPAATASEKTGKPMSWETSPPVGAVHGISAYATTVIVLEGT